MKKANIGRLHDLSKRVKNKHKGTISIKRDPDLDKVVIVWISKTVFHRGQTTKLRSPTYCLREPEYSNREAFLRVFTNIMSEFNQYLDNLKDAGIRIR